MLRTRNKAFNKLRLALDISKKKERSFSELMKNTSFGTDSFLIEIYKEKIEFIDLRKSVFAILYRVGFERNNLN